MVVFDEFVNDSTHKVRTVTVEKDSDIVLTYNNIQDSTNHYLLELDKFVYKFGGFLLVF